MSNDGRYITRTVTTEEHHRAPPRIVYDVDFTHPELDVGYLRTLSGMLKCIAIALDFICFICILVGGPAYYMGAGWATFVCTFGMTVTTTLLILYLFRIVDMFRQVPWIVSEMVFCFAWAMFFFICGCVLAIAAARFSGVTGYGAAAFFAFGAMCTYGFDSYIKFLAWKHDEVATGGGPREDYSRSYPSSTPHFQKVIIAEPQQY